MYYAYFLIFTQKWKNWYTKKFSDNKFYKKKMYLIYIPQSEPRERF